MKKYNGYYVLSNSDKKKIEMHARAIAKKAAYNGAVEVWFDAETGTINYMECIGLDYYKSDSSTMECIYRVSTQIR